jgi:hypothetical protein
MHLKFKISMCHGQKKKSTQKDSQRAQTPRQVMTRVNLVLSWNMKYENQLQKHKTKNIKHARRKLK